jgi:hypothetical protein
MITNSEMEEIFLQDNWVLAYLKKHKANPLHYPMDLKKCKESVEQDLYHAESGMYIGVGYHGGMTHEEWKSEHDRLRLILHELNEQM